MRTIHRAPITLFFRCKCSTAIFPIRSVLSVSNINVSTIGFNSMTDDSTDSSSERARAMAPTCMDRLLASQHSVAQPADGNPVVSQPMRFSTNAGPYRSRCLRTETLRAVSPGTEISRLPAFSGRTVIHDELRDYRQIQRQSRNTQIASPSGHVE